MGEAGAEVCVLVFVDTEETWLVSLLWGANGGDVVAAYGVEAIDIGVGGNCCMK